MTRAVQSPAPSADEACQEALKTVQYATTPHGIVASTTGADNYCRVWARDAVVAGLGGLLAGDDIITEGLRRSLEILAANIGPDGQIPSNVQVGDDGEVKAVSFGTIAGRVDPIPWFVIGTCSYAMKTGDDQFATRLRPQMRKALDLLETWEFNRKGLVYVPQGGDWADEYILSGYTFLPQVLRLWAEELYADYFEDDISTGHAEQLRELLCINYWPLESTLSSPHVYHPAAYQRYLDRYEAPKYFLACLSPAGYTLKFDALGNAIALIRNLSGEAAKERTLTYFQETLGTIATGLPPAFWPPIFEKDPEWPLLTQYYLYEFSNAPFQSSNGGSWPMLAGWWVLALAQSGQQDLAEALFANLCRFNALGQDGEDWGFYEYGHSKTGLPMGVRRITWSASAVLMGKAALEGKRLSSQ